MPLAKAMRKKKIKDFIRFNAMYDGKPDPEFPDAMNWLYEQGAISQPTPEEIQKAQAMGMKSPMSDTEYQANKAASPVSPTQEGFITKCAELGINPNVMAKYAAGEPIKLKRTPVKVASPIRATSPVQEGFIAKCAELGINPSVMGKYAFKSHLALGIRPAGVIAGGLLGSGVGAGIGAIGGKKDEKRRAALKGALIGSLMGAGFGGVDADVSLSFANPAKAASPVQEGFIAKCAELGINPITMTKYAQIKWEGIGEQVKGLGTKAVDWAKANPEMAGAAGGAIAGSLGGALLGGKDNRMLGAALGAVGGGALGYGAGRGYSAYQGQQRELSRVAKEHGDIGKQIDNANKIRALQQQRAKNVANDSALDYQAANSTYGGLFGQGVDQYIMNPIKQFGADVMAHVDQYARYVGEGMYDDANAYLEKLDIATKKKVIQALALQQGQ